MEPLLQDYNNATTTTHDAEEEHSETSPLHLDSDSYINEESSLALAINASLEEFEVQCGHFCNDNSGVLDSTLPWSSQDGDPRQVLRNNNTNFTLTQPPTRTAN